MQKSLLVLFASFIFLSGCATIMERNPHSQYIKNLDWPLTEIRGLCNTQLPVGQGSMSSNGRELRSKPFIVAKNEYKDAGEANDRNVLLITILGDSRPYEVEVLVTRERKILRDGVPTYVRIGYDDRLTKELQIKIQTELTKRREDRNIIDDFRVY